MPTFTDERRNDKNQRVYYINKTWETQSKPYDKALPYELLIATSVNEDAPNTTAAYNCGSIWTNGAASNAAISNLQSKLQKAQLGNALGEYKTSAKMIGSRARQIHQAYRDVRRGRLGDAASTLGITMPKRSRAKSAAGVWLEYHYGWRPLLDDVYGATEVFREPRQPKLIRFSGRSSKSTKDSSRGVWTSSPFYNIRTIESNFRSQAEAVCHLRDITALQRLQLDNPLSVAWELVPFSFIADWFLPIGTYINSLSPSFTRQMVSSSVTVKCNASSSIKWTCEARRAGGCDAWVDNGSSSGEAFYMRRTPGLNISPTIDRSFLQGDSFTRAGHAIALLVSIFSTRDGEELPNTIWNRPLL